MTDINRTGLIARLPRAVQGYAVLARIDRPIGIWLLFLPGAWGILLARPALPQMWRLLLLFFVGSVVMRAAGCVVNDAWDRDLDRKVARTAARPLASGEVSLRRALVFLAGLLGCGLAVLLQLNRPAQMLGVGSLFLVALYPLAKRVTWWPQLVMGFTFGFGAPMGVVAAAGKFPPYLVFLYMAATFWDLGFDTIYGFQDIEDDTLAGIKSTSRRFAGAPKKFIGAAFLLMMFCLLAAGYMAKLHLLFYLALCLPAALLWRQVVALTPQNPAACLAAFRAHRDIGILVTLAIALGTA